MPGVNERKSGFAEDLRLRIGEALSDEENSDLKTLVEHLESIECTAKINGKWQLEGFVLYLYKHHRLAREIDPSIGSCLPNHCLNPRSIANFFNLPPKTFNSEIDVAGTRGTPGRRDKTSHLAHAAEKLLQKGMNWTQVYDEIAAQFPDDERASDSDKIYAAHRRHYRNKDKRNRKKRQK